MSVESEADRVSRRASPDFRDQSLTVDQFCRAENISRSMLYRAWSEGWGPRFYRVGVTRRITYRSRLEWQHEREAAAAGGEWKNDRPDS